MTLPPADRRRIRETLDAVRDVAIPLTLLFYGRLFELDPSARRLFHNDIARQGQKLLDTLTALADSLDDFDAMRPRLIDLGRRHAEYGVRSNQYETMITAFVWALGHALGADFDQTTRDAWRMMLTEVSHVMQAGGGPSPGSSHAH